MIEKKTEAKEHLVEVEEEMRNRKHLLKNKNLKRRSIFNQIMK